MTGCIVGWAHTKVGKHEDRDVESLITEVATGALADAGVAAADVDDRGRHQGLDMPRWRPLR